MLWIVIPVLIVIIDQVTKYIVLKNISLNQMIPVIEDFFYLTLHKNSGGAWGILQNSRIFFLVAIPVISAGVIYSIVKNKNSVMRLALSLILGGAIGNYIDRLLFGTVTDFFLFYIGPYPFPVFNVADIAVTCGTILLVVYMLFIYKEPQEEGKEEAGND